MSADAKTALRPAHGQIGILAAMLAAVRARPWRVTLMGCLALAALSLLLPSQPTYDPWAWIIWGREIVHLDLVTTQGPSWKPLPVMFTVPFSLFGDGAAPDLWLIVARAGGLLAFAMTYRLAARLAGPWAGVIAVAALFLADEYIRNFARGNSEGLLVAFVLWAVECHLDRRYRDAFLLGFAASLLRPEIWPFFGLYGLWLGWQEPRRRPLVAGCFAGLLALWFLPEWWGSGDPLRQATRARQPTPDSAAFADVPFLEVLHRSAGVLAPPVLAGAAVALLRGWRVWRREGREGLRLTFGAAAGILLFAVAAMTQVGFAGNLRYVALPAALVCVLAGAGWVELLRSARRLRGTVAAVALAAGIALASAPFVALAGKEFGEKMELVRFEADVYRVLPRAIQIAGGRDRILSCGSITTGPFDTQALAWHLRVHSERLRFTPLPPGTVLAPKRSQLAHDKRFPFVGRTTEWIVRQRCER
jgi:hypothetical protein